MTTPRNPKYYQEGIAKYEGWLLSSRDDGRWEIQKYDEGHWRYDSRFSQLMPPFETDQEAEDYVRTRARFSPMHNEALLLNGTPTHHRMVKI